MLYLLIGTILVQNVASAELPQTTLFIELDSHWKHNESGDLFVARTDVSNIGENPAIGVFVKLKDIPDGWHVYPCCYLICQLDPDHTEVRYFIIERDETDATIFASARAVNADEVISNKIAIPIFPGIAALTMVACGLVYYQDLKKKGRI